MENPPIRMSQEVDWYMFRNQVIITHAIASKGH